jgi:hypothetical protein
MNTNEHPAVHSSMPHVLYWGRVKKEAEESVKHLLEGGDSPIALFDILDKDTITSPDDWDEIMDYCKDNGASCHDINRLYRASAAWLQAFNELEYKRLYP